MNRRKSLWVVLSLLAVLPFPAAAQRPRKAPPEPADVAAFRKRVEAELVKERVDKGHWGVFVVDAASGETIYALNSGQYFTPASNTKLYTTILALATLGPDFHFRTTVETRGRIDARGRLIGDLLLVGRGDPNLSNRKLPHAKEVEREGPPEKILAELADGVVARGVKQIEGDIVGDDTYFPLDRYPTGWAIDDMPAGFGAPVSALTVNDNVIGIEIRPGEREGDAAWFSVEPWAEFYAIVNQIRTGAAGSEQRLRVEREPGSRRIVLRGTIPVDRPAERPSTLTIAVEEPAEYWAAVFKRLLEARGVRIYGAARAVHAPLSLAPLAPNVKVEVMREPAEVLAEHRSAPLIEAVRVVNKISQNLHAELLLRAAGMAKYGVGTTEAGLRAAQELYTSIGIPEREVVVYDGSGLSRRNLVTPRGTVALLRWAATQPWYAQFIFTLPVAGEDGTLAERLKNLSAAGRIRAKTGTLGNVNALSGFATSVHGKSVVFSMFGNAHNLRGRESTSALDAICFALVEELGKSPARRRR
jgi:D-alanyl-D-alanine carboxypeptidase/D-alanyl-D-alanine-endopeptidase (penicillin-binding protein 4)